MATSEQLMQAVAVSAFTQQVPMANLIHLFEGGSALHGARLEGKADLDICGVFYEPKIKLFGLQPMEHFVTSTSDDTERNTPDDVDITLFSLRRWASLACKGNPTALSFLFAENALKDWRWGYCALGNMQQGILAKSCAGHFSGFVTSQMGRLLGTRGNGKHGQRPELGAQFGYDTKAAMHAVRLCGEGIELLEEGFIRYPRPNVAELIDIRTGKYPLDKICDIVNRLLVKLENAHTASKLQAKPDYAKVNGALVEACEEFYYTG